MKVKEKNISKIYFFKFICFISYLLLNLSFKQIKVKEIKVCLCSPGKNENRYIKEFVEHYKNYGVDKIFLYDNNDLDGEFFQQEINNYIKSNFVEIINFRGKIRPLFDMMNDCYKKNFKNYDWLIFFEMDEYIHLNNFKNIKKFLNNDKFNNCQKIQLNWVIHTDNNLLYYENRPLKERFPEIEDKAKKNNINTNIFIKCILKGHIPNIKIRSVHSLNHNLQSCDGFGNYVKDKGPFASHPDFRNYYIDHYTFKSTEEFVNKLNKGDALFKDNRLFRIQIYFKFNKATKEKIKLIEEGTGFNLSTIRKKIKT
jgi:hypothetical protein